MKLKELKALQAYHQYPSVSVLLPTHRTHPENQQDPIRLKELLTEAETRLHEEFEKRFVAKLMGRLHEMADEIDHQHNLEGLVLFANENHTSYHRLAFAVEARVVIDETFATRDLVRNLLIARDYLLLTLSDRSIRLFEGHRDQLAEVRGHGFPADLRGMLNPWRKGSAEHNDDGKRKEHYNRLDKSLTSLNRIERLPVVLAGLDKNIATYKEIADRKELIAAELSGNFDETPLHELGKQVNAVLADKLAQRLQDELAQLNAAVGAGKTASGLQQVWRQANYGLGHKLFVENNFRKAGTVGGADGLTLTFVDDPTLPGISDDLVDEVIETVMQMGGDVVFVEDGTLAQHQGIALILRG
jgi:hypothetical protein